MDEEQRKKLNETAREIVNLLGLLNEAEKTSSRLRNELTEMYLKVNNKLDIDKKKENNVA